jgi:hypothetical protein
VIIRCSLLLSLLVATTLPAQGGTSAPPRTARDSATQAITRFFAAWENAWFDSELRRFPEQSGAKADVHCHAPDLFRETPLYAGVAMRSARSAFAVCPIWRYRTIGPSDERLVLDAALDVEAQPEGRAARDTLLAMLEPLAAAHPADTLLVGQTVRFLVDHRVWDRAYALTQHCAAAAWWCALLEGYLWSRRQLPERAEVAFRRAVQLAPAAERCAWDDLRALIPGLPRRGCAERAAQADSIWWLADPLWSVAGNERWVEQMTRDVHLRLRTALPRDERWRWTAAHGNDARVLMVQRYGWPTYVHWGGWDVEFEHDTWLLNQEIPGVPNKPYTSYEYDRGRQVLLPPPEVLADPFGAPVESWPWPLAAGDTWPKEHAALAYPMQGLPSGQTVFLRRQDSVRVGVSTLLFTDDIGREAGAVVQGVLVGSTGPGDAELLGAAFAPAGDVLRVDAMLVSRPVVLSVEIPPDVSILAPAARVRYGVRPPAALSALRAGEVAVSQPVLVEVGAGADAVAPTGPDAALGRLLPSRLAQGQLGVYWESYGVAAADSIEVAVALTQEAGGVLTRAGRLVGLVPTRTTPVVTSWMERPGGSGRVVVEEGPVPVLGRGVVLDVSSVPAGVYWLEVSVGGARERVRVEVVGG